MTGWQIMVIGTDGITHSCRRNARSKQIYTNKKYAQSQIEDCIKRAIKQGVVLSGEEKFEEKPVAILIEVEIVDAKLEE